MPGPRAADRRPHARDRRQRAGAGLTTGLTVECFGDRVGDIRLYRHKRDERRIWPPLLPELDAGRRPSRRAARPRCRPRAVAAPDAPPTSRAARTARPPGGRGAPSGRGAGDERRRERSRRRATRLDESAHHEHEHHEHDDDTSTTPRPRDPLPLPHLHDLRRLPRDRTPDCLLLLLLPAHPHARPPPACRRPASGPPASCLGCPARFIWQVEEGGSSAKRWTPLPRKPRRERNLGRRRGGGPVIS